MSATLSQDHVDLELAIAEAVKTFGMLGSMPEQIVRRSVEEPPHNVQDRFIREFVAKAKRVIRLERSLRCIETSAGDWLVSREEIIKIMRKEAHDALRDV